MKKIGKIAWCVGVGLAAIVCIGLIIVAAPRLIMLIPFIDNTMADINIKATRESLHGPYTHSNLGDRWEILYAKAFGSEAAKRNFPPRKLKPLNPDLPPWVVNLSPEELKAEMIKIGIKIGMPVAVMP